MLYAVDSKGDSWNTFQTKTMPTNFLIDKGGKIVAVAAGCDGVHIEVHSCPEKALSDGPQALLPERYARLMDELRQLADLMGKTIDACEGVTV